MLHNPSRDSKELTIAINSTDNSFGFAFRKNNNPESDTFFMKKIENNLCNNLIIDFNRFIGKEDLQKVKSISVSIGPANFNASRMVVVLARTISQQINCPLRSFSPFRLMSKRIAINNNIFKKHQTFWIYKQLKRKGFIAGKYEICNSDKANEKNIISEKTVPVLIKELSKTEPNFQANFNDKEDLKELLNLSSKNLQETNINTWQKVIPLYPLSPIN